MENFTEKAEHYFKW